MASAPKGFARATLAALVAYAACIARAPAGAGEPALGEPSIEDTGVSKDRMPVHVEVQLSLDGKRWQTVRE